MKLLASDYDGTLKYDKINLQLNIKAVQEFMQNGNIFAIVTGRCFESIKKEIDTYNIPYDYLSCNNGLVLFDNNDKLICSSFLHPKVLKLICERANNYGAKNIIFYNEYGKTIELNNIVELLLTFDSINNAVSFKGFITTELNNIKCYIFGKNIILGKALTKADAINAIKNIENIDVNDIYTVGDYKNDIEMLQKYNGYKMFSSYPKLWGKGLPTTMQVHRLIKKIGKK